MPRKSAIDPQALALMRAGNFAAALPLAERSIAGITRCSTAHAFLTSLYIRLGRIDDAEKLLSDSARLASDDAAALDGLAFAATELGQHELANDLYRRATELAPEVPRQWHNLASSERSFGRLEAAELACERAIALDATQYPSLLLRSELGVQTRQHNHVDDLKARLSRARDATGRIFVGYALAKELDDLGDFDQAFAQFSTAAALRRAQLRYDIGQDASDLEHIAQTFGRRVASGGDTPCHERDIFIIGLPRTGTTLLERILTGLPDVRSNGETDNFARAFGMSVQSTAKDELARLVGAPAHAVAARYHQLGRVRGDGPAVIEKLPTNYLYVGAIRRALPDAKILLLQRSPLDACFAMFRSLFGNAYPFSYDFVELARYCAAYEKLMRHWLKLFGDAIHVVPYEDLVRTPEAVGQAVASHCELPWRTEALDIRHNRSASLTASATQVRRPIYGTSSGRWRAYRAHLRPLIDALRTQGVALPDDA